MFAIDYTKFFNPIKFKGFFDCLLPPLVSLSFRNFIGFFQTFTITMSLYLLLFGAIDRLLAISLPIQYAVVKFSKLKYVAIITSLAISFSIGIFPVFSKEESGKAYSLVANLLVVSIGKDALLTYSIILGLPLFLQWIMAIVILLIIFQRSRKMSSKKASTVLTKNRASKMTVTSSLGSISSNPRKSSFENKIKSPRNNSVFKLNLPTTLEHIDETRLSVFDRKDSCRGSDRSVNTNLTELDLDEEVEDRNKTVLKQQSKLRKSSQPQSVHVKKPVQLKISVNDEVIELDDIHYGEVNPAFSSTSQIRQRNTVAKNRSEPEPSVQRKSINSKKNSARKSKPRLPKNLLKRSSLKNLKRKISSITQPSLNKLQNFTDKNAEEIKATKTLSLMILMFTICILPATIIMILELSNPPSSDANLFDADYYVKFLSLEFIFVILLMSNALGNFLVYSFYSKKFRKHFVELMHEIRDKFR